MRNAMKKLFLFTAILMLSLPTAHAEDNRIEEAELRDIQSGESPLRGTVTLRATGGLYDYNNSYYYSGDESRTRSYSTPIPWPIYGIDIAVRMGRDENLFHAPGRSSGAYKPGFTYYRSNRGIYIDIETGYKWFGNPPEVYNVRDSDGTNKTVHLEKWKNEYLLPSGYVLNGDVDGIEYADTEIYGTNASLVFMFYMNNYFHVTPVNLLMNFGEKFRWWDTSLGFSMRAATYSDYADPKRLLSNHDDNTIGYYAIVWRQYVQLHDLVRLRLHYYWNFIGTVARVTKEDGYNQEEHVYDTGLDLFVLPYTYVTIGYENHHWIGNPASSDRFNRSGGSEFDNTRNNLIFDKRISKEAYLGLAFEIPYLP